MRDDERTIPVLIAEDSPTQAEQLKYILERNGYRVTVAENGVKALAQLAAHETSMVISDIVMPQMDGYELCRRIRADENTSALPVLLLTALTDTKDVLEGLSCGADGFITKPYTEEYLLAIVSRMLNDRQQSTAADSAVSIDVVWAGKKCTVVTDQKRAVSLLISTYEAAVRRNTELSRTQSELRRLNERLEELVADRTAALSAEITVRRQTEERLHEQLEELRRSQQTTLDRSMVELNLKREVNELLIRSGEQPRYPVAETP